MAGTARDLGLFNLSVDRKLRGCDRVALQVRDVMTAVHVNVFRRAILTP